MGVGGKRLIVTIAVTGQSQETNAPVSLGRVNQIILSSTESEQTFEFSIENEKGDIVFGPRDIAVPENFIKPNLLPMGVLTMKVINPIPASGTVTAIILTENR